MQIHKMVDLSFLKKFTKENPAKMKRYISMYLDIAPEILDRMKQDIEQENWESLAINAHSLKPQTDYMGINTLKDVLISIENKAIQGQNKELSSLLEKAYDIHNKSVHLLNLHMQDL